MVEPVSVGIFIGVCMLVLKNIYEMIRSRREGAQCEAQCTNIHSSCCDGNNTKGNVAITE